MTDPLDVLRTGDGPVDPDPTFAAALRARLERALLAPSEIIMTSSTLTVPTALVDPHTLTPMLRVADARAAVAFYVAAFGATRRGEPWDLPDGRVAHAEVVLGDSVLMLADDNPPIGLVSPARGGGTGHTLRLETPDPDGVVATAVAAGATLERPVVDEPYGRTGMVIDPDGHRWMITRDVPAARAGDVVYASLWAPDQDRTVAFYSRVLGWEVAGGHVHALGLGTASAEQATLYCCYRVPDVEKALALVRAAGGSAEEPVEEPWGPTAMCVDDQGIPFAVTSGATPPLPGGSGSLGYAELRVPDAGRARAFYGTVLGWRFTPGGDDGYWHALDVAPLIGLAGGHGEAAVTPWFRVADLAAAVAAVRSGGGTAADPAPTRHGHEATCTDDQGTPFTLTQD